MARIDGRNRIVLSFITTAFYLLYLLIWGAIVAFCILANINGMFYIFSDAWGEWSVYFGFLLAVIVACSPLYLRKISKITARKSGGTKLLIPILSILLTIVFLFISIGCFFLSANQFQEFTAEKWKEYPRERYIMLDDLIAQHGIIDMHGDQIYQLLGTPDEITSYQSWLYSYEYGFIEVSFDGDNTVSSITLH